MAHHMYRRSSATTRDYLKEGKAIGTQRTLAGLVGESWDFRTIVMLSACSCGRTHIPAVAVAAQVQVESGSECELARSHVAEVSTRKVGFNFQQGRMTPPLKRSNIGSQGAGDPYVSIG